LSPGNISTVAILGEFQSAFQSFMTLLEEVTLDYS
jgi:hypothetical protein